MQRYRVLRFGLFGVLVAFAGCKSKIVMIVTPNPVGTGSNASVIQTVEPGQTLEWRAIGPSVGNFTVAFFGAGPCEEQSYPSNNGVVDCKVVSQGNGPIFYRYQIQPTGKSPLRAKSCNGCQVIGNPTGMGFEFTPDSTGNPGLIANSVYPSGQIYIECQGTTISVEPEVDPVSSVIWSPGPNTDGWKATFDSSSPCIEKGPFSSGNLVCTYSATAVPNKYPYHLTNVGSCGSPATPYYVTVSPPAKP